VHLIALLAFALAAAMLLGPVDSASAVQAQVHTDNSFYVHTTSASAFTTAGTNAGNSDKNNGYTWRTTILDFGGQLSNGSGTEIFNGAHVTNAQIKALAEDFATAYWNHTGGSGAFADILIGTNNSIASGVTSANGTVWGNLVDSLNTWANNRGYEGRVTFDGANDMEPSWGGSSSRAHTVNWSNAYSNASSSLMWDYGSSDGCPETTHTNGACNNAWTQKAEWNVSGQTPGAIGFPQIYFSSQASQWTQIVWYAATQGGADYMAGPLNEHNLDSGSFTPAQAWTTFWNDLNAHSATAEDFFAASGMNLLS